jgi:hypothetical protein
MFGSSRRATVRKSLSIIEEDEDEAVSECDSPAELRHRITDGPRKFDAVGVTGHGVESDESSAGNETMPSRAHKVPLGPVEQSRLGTSARSRRQEQRGQNTDQIREFQVRLQETQDALRKTQAEVSMLRAHVSALEMALEERNIEVRRLREQLASSAPGASATLNVQQGKVASAVGRDLLGLLRSSHASAADSPISISTVSEGALKPSLPSRLVELRANTSPTASSSASNILLGTPDTGKSSMGKR